MALNLLASPQQDFFFVCVGRGECGGRSNLAQSNKYDKCLGGKMREKEPNESEK